MKKSDDGLRPPGLPPGIKVTHWGKTRPAFSPQARSRPFGQPNTPFNPMTGKFMALGPEPEDDTPTPSVTEVAEIVNNYLAEHPFDLSTLPGWDAGAVQHLTNVTGTVQWVTTRPCPEGQ